MLQLKHMNLKFYLFLIRKPLQLHKSSLFQININSLSPDPENIHSNGIPLIHCWLVQVFARLSPEVTAQFIATFLICEQTQPLKSVTHCSVTCPHILLTSAKTHLHMWIHRQVWMPGRSKEELPESTATWKQARKGMYNGACHPQDKY